MSISPSCKVPFIAILSTIALTGCFANSDDSLRDVSVIEASLSGPLTPEASSPSALEINAAATVADADGIPYIAVALPVEIPSYFGGAHITLNLRGFDTLAPGRYHGGTLVDGTAEALPEHVYISMGATAGTIIDLEDNGYQYVAGFTVDNYSVELASDGTVQLDLDEPLWPTLTDLSTRIQVNLDGFPVLPEAPVDDNVGTSED